MRQARAWLLRWRGLQTQCVDSAEGLMEHLGLDHGPQLPRQACCLLLDVRMPKMTGVELQALMVKSGDRTPVIFMSGESLPHEPLAAQQSNAVTFLWKHFRTEALLNAVNQGLLLYDQLDN